MADRPALDVDFVRSQFPAFAAPETGPWAFFDNAGGSYVPGTVINRLNHFMVAAKVQPGSPSAPSVSASAEIDHSTHLMESMINANPGAVILGPSTTANLYVLAQALRPQLRAGDEIIVTNQDHEANGGAWRRLAESGITIHEWQVDPLSGELDPQDLDHLITDRTRLVCFTHCSNILGSIHDVKAITAKAHEAGALVMVDGVSYAPHRRIDVKDLDVDFYAFSLYKLYGPHLGLLYGKHDLLAAAANQNHYFLARIVPLTLMPGGLNHELTASLSGITDYFDALYEHHFEAAESDLRCRLDKVFDLITQHEARIGSKFIDFIATKPAVRLIGKSTAERARRAPTFSFTHATLAPHEITAALLPDKIAASNGCFYANRCLDALGIDTATGVSRVSMVHYNCEAEVDRLIGTLDRIL